MRGALRQACIDCLSGFAKTVAVADTTATGSDTPNNARSPASALSVTSMHAYNAHRGPGGAVFGLAGFSVCRFSTPVVGPAPSCGNEQRASTTH